MRIAHRLWASLEALLRRNHLDADLDEELREYLAAAVDDKLRRGMSLEQATREARASVGSLAAVKEHIRDAGIERFVDAIARDLTYTWRGLRRSPVLSATIVLTIAVGIAGAGGMYSVMRNLLLAPPPHVTTSSRVFRFHQVISGVSTDTPAEPSARSAYPFYERLAQHATTIDGVAAYMATELPAGARTDAGMSKAVLVSAGFARTLGVQTPLGRWMLDDETHPATGRRVVVLSDAYWRGVFGGDRHIVGQTLRVKGQPYQIVGVAPRGFRGVELADVDLWLPLFALEDGSGRRPTWHTFGASFNLQIVMRLHPGVTREQAEAELTTLHRSFLVDTYAPIFRDSTRLDRYRTARVLLGPVTGGLGDNLRPIPEARVTRWLVAVAVVLLIVACSNVAGLVLLRTLRRRREVAVRLALGVTHRRLVQQMFTESAVLGLLGGVTALVLVLADGQWLQHTILADLAWDARTLVEPDVLLMVIACTLAAVVSAGTMPLLFVRADVLSVLHDGSGGGIVRRPGLQSVLLVTQGALSLVLLIGAGLFLRSLHNVETLDIGFDRNHVLAAQIDFSGTGRRGPDVAAFFDRALARVTSLPEVDQASLALNVPLRVARGGGSVRIAGRTDAITGPSGSVPLVNYVSSRFFSTTGMRVVQGRDFTAEEMRQPVIVVSETMARLGWGRTSPVGACVYLQAQQTCTTVIGVVADAIVFRIANEPPRPYYYTPLTTEESGSRALLVRVRPGTRDAMSTIRHALQEIDPQLPFVRIDGLGDALDPEMRPWRLGASVLTVFGVLAIALAVIGLWGSVSYAVSQRRNEFAVRFALGASPWVVLVDVLRDGLGHATAAVAVGLTVAASASGRLEDLLFKVSAHDGAVFALAAIAVLLVSIIACLPPAYRAARIRPAQALRSE